MDMQTRYPRRITEILFSMLALAILLGFSVGMFAYIPYTGLYFDPNTGVVLDVYVPGHADLRPGDVLIKVGDVFFDDYKKNAAQPLFQAGLQKGDILPILVNRDGSETHVDWEIPGFELVGFRGRLVNIFWLAYIYWFFGAVVEMFIRPRDVRWRLFIAANHLTSLWLMFGAISSWHLMGASVLFRSFTWLILPVYLHLHWIFPQPLSRLPKFSGILLYTAAGLLFIAELMQLLQSGLFYLAFILALGGSVILLVLHFIIRPAQRRQIRLLALSTFLSILPALILGIMGLFDELPVYAPLAIAALTLMPPTYLYLVFRSQLGGLEARANRFISTFAFLIIVGLALIVVAHTTASLPGEISSLLIIAIPLLVSVFSIDQFPRFETFMEKNLLGIKLPYQHLPETYSGRIAASDDLPSLLDLLENEVFPSLLVRQYAFLQVQGKTLNVLLAKAIAEDSFDFDILTQKAGRYLPNLPPDEGWLRLILPLKVGDSTLGFWLLGRRDPDDLYPQAEIPILGSLADQTAIALSSIVNADRLREYYRTELDIVGDERNRIARDLHETVLNKLADMRNSLDQKTLPPGFLASYDELKTQLREIISNLRPPLLDQGLAFAVNEMVEDFREKNEGVTIVLDLQSGEGRPPEKVEEHLFHIAHEACENALKHSECRTLTISGVVSSERVDLSIQDDGKGFDPDALRPAPPDDRHYGLTHMKERAHIIGAELDIRSRNGQGATVRVSWRLIKS